MARYLRLLFILLLPALTHAQSLVINEYTCSNKSQYPNSNNEYDDWVEIYNPTFNTINLAGYYLSDKATDPTKWAIPAGITIASNGHKIFFCNGKDLVQGNEYNTNFKLTQCKQEYILIANPAGQIIDSVHIVRNTQKNHAMARITDGAATWGVALNPTPGTANTNVKPYYAAKPVASQQGGLYGSAITVALTTTEPNSVIHYTVDGSEPTAGSTQYTTPINVSTTKAIRAKTFSNTAGVPASFIESNTYVIGATHTVPVFCLNGNFNSLFNGNTDELQHAIEYYDAAGQLIFKTEGDMKPHGNDSWAFDQKGMRFYTRDEYGFSNNIEAQLFPSTPRDEFDVVIIKAAGSDNYPCASNMHGLNSCHLRDAYSQTLAAKYHLNVDTRSFRPVVVYINGQYWGVYELRERVDADYTDFYYDQPQAKVDMLAYWGWLQLDEGSDTAWVALYDFMMNNDLSIPANYSYVAQRFNLMSLIDYFILDTYTVNTDWLNWNTAWWRGTKDAGVPWRYHLWDMDNTFDLGQNYTGMPTTGYTNDPCAVEDLFPNDPDIPHTGMFNKLMANPTFEQLYINRYADLINTAFNCDAMLAHLDSLAALLAPEMPGQCQRWSGNMVEWNAHLQYMRDQISGRCAVIAGGMVDCYNLTGPYNVTVVIDPVGSPNNVQVNTLVPPLYPYVGNYFGNNNIQLAAMADPTYTFQNWTLNNSTALPDNFNPNIQVALGSQDTIVAHFKKKVVIGIDEQGNDIGISVFPSPTSNRLNVMLSSKVNKPLAMNILSIDGKLVYSQSNVSFAAANGNYLYSIDLGSMGLAPGVYFIRLDDGNKPTVARFVFSPEN